MPKGLKFAVCLDGANACPPGDVGGSSGYEHLLTALADPNHEEHEHLSQWVGRPVDPAAFDLGLVNAHLQAVRRSRDEARGTGLARDRRRQARR